MTPDRRAGRPAPAGPGRGTLSAAIMLRIRRIAAQARAVPGFPKPSLRAALSAVWCTAWRRSAWLAGWLAGYSTGGMPLPDEFDRLARRHLDVQIGFLYRDAADTADQVADVEQEPELPGRPLGDLRSEERRVGKECRSRWS